MLFVAIYWTDIFVMGMPDIKFEEVPFIREWDIKQQQQQQQQKKLYSSSLSWGTNMKIELVNFIMIDISCSKFCKIPSSWHKMHTYI